MLVALLIACLAKDNIFSLKGKTEQFNVVQNVHEMEVVLVPLFLESFCM